MCCVKNNWNISIFIEQISCVNEQKARKKDLHVNYEKVDKY